MDHRYQKIISRKFLIVVPKLYRENNELKMGDVMIVWTGPQFMAVLPEKLLKGMMRHEELLLEALLHGEDPALTVDKLLRQFPEIERKLKLRRANEEQANISPSAPGSHREFFGGVEKAQDLGPILREEKKDVR